MKITAIHLDNKEFKDYKVYGSETNKLEGLSKLNICIGENNSGKSRFIRALIKAENTRLNFALDIDKNIQKLTGYKFNKDEFNEATAVTNIKFHTDRNKINTDDNFIHNNLVNLNEKYKSYISVLLTELTSYKLDIINNTIYNDLIYDLIIGKIKIINKNIINSRDLITNKLYTPILRGYRARYTDVDYSIKKQIFYEYFSEVENGKSKNILVDNIKTNENLYDILKNNLLSKKSNRDKVILFESFLSKNFFSNEDVSVTPDLGIVFGLNNVVNILIGDNEEREREIHNLGDGISNLIDIIFPLFMHRDEIVYSFIEEPETHLHPGMQRILIESLLNEEYFPNFQFFITTHSNHFLDLAFEYPEDISIFHFQKKIEADKEYFEINPTTADDIKVLDSLGVRNSSVFLSNCTIWVEGITDRLYLKKYLELYQEYLLLTDNTASTYHEDLHYSFFEYAGSNIVHWDFNYNTENDDVIQALKISNRVFLITDTDDTITKPNSEKAKRLNRFEQLNTDKVIKFKRVPTIEMDNTIHEEILTLATNDINSHTNPNGVVSFTKYKHKRLGTYIDDTFYNGVKTFANSDKEKSEGKTYTIKSDKKLKLCKKAVQLMQTNWENAKDKIQNNNKISVKDFQKMVKITPVAFELGKKIYDFIKEHNSK